MPSEEHAAADTPTGQVGYERYGRAVGWRAVGGGAMPQWEQLAPRIQGAWSEAARGILGLPPGCEPGEHAPRPPGDAS